MKGFQKLTLKRILKKHKIYSRDKEMHNAIEKGELEKKEFNKLIVKGTKQKAFDKNLQRSTRKVS